MKISHWEKIREEKNNEYYINAQQNLINNNINKKILISDDGSYRGYINLKKYPRICQDLEIHIKKLMDTRYDNWLPRYSDFTKTIDDLIKWFTTSLRNRPCGISRLEKLMARYIRKHELYDTIKIKYNF